MPTESSLFVFVVWSVVWRWGDKGQKVTSASSTKGDASLIWASMPLQHRHRHSFFPCFIHSRQCKLRTNHSKMKQLFTPHWISGILCKQCRQANLSSCWRATATVITLRHCRIWEKGKGRERERKHRRKKIDRQKFGCRIKHFLRRNAFLCAPLQWRR